MAVSNLSSQDLGEHPERTTKYLRAEGKGLYLYPWQIRENHQGLLLEAIAPPLLLI